MSSLAEITRFLGLVLNFGAYIEDLGLPNLHKEGLPSSFIHDHLFSILQLPSHPSPSSLFPSSHSSYPRIIPSPHLGPQGRPAFIQENPNSKVQNELQPSIL